MSNQGQLMDQLAADAPPPPGPTIPPPDSRYSLGNVAYMLFFGAVAWVGGKLAETVAAPAIETVVDEGKSFVNSFTKSEDEDEPTDEEEDEPPPLEEEDDEELEE